LWDLVISAKQLRIMTPLLEGVLSKVTAEKPAAPAVADSVDRLPVSGGPFIFSIDGTDVVTATADRNGKAEIELEVAVSRRAR
jgi:hypothetical protein